MIVISFAFVKFYAFAILYVLIVMQIKLVVVVVLRVLGLLAQRVVTGTGIFYTVEIMQLPVLSCYCEHPIGKIIFFCHYTRVSPGDHPLARIEA